MYGRVNTQPHNVRLAQLNEPQVFHQQTVNTQALTTLNSARLNQGSKQVQTGHQISNPGQMTEPQYYSNIHYGKQCYSCGE